MRALGHGHAGIEKFTNLMDMPKPMTKKNYEKMSDKLGEVVKEVAEQSMKDAAQELRTKVNAGENDVVDIGVSCDGTWQKRGFQSLNGVFAALSIDNGKVLDVEAMNRTCKACVLKEPLRRQILMHLLNGVTVIFVVITIREVLEEWKLSEQSVFLRDPLTDTI